MVKHLAKQFHELNLGGNSFRSVDDFRLILLDSIPIVDVRSPIEFAKGSVPNAVNLPLLSDADRERVGVAFREGGQTQAISRGHELLPKVKRNLLVAGWIEFLEEHPNALICCWRGGLRSKIVQSWLQEEGWQVPRIDGGSKALRAFCLATIEAAAEINFVVLAGRTGSGKTLLVNELSPAIDFEGLAQHRGSAFGGDTTTQPTPVSFESRLAQDFLRIQSATTVLVEDESRVIGKLAIPESLFNKMGHSPVVVLEAEEAARLRHIYQNYVRGTAESVILANLGKIRKRLGMKRYLEIQASIKNAFNTGDREDHFHWLTLLLRYYYDPMYDYQLARKKERVIFSGCMSSVKELLLTNYEFKAN